MKVDVNTWWAKIALSSKLPIYSDCSLIRALLFGLIRRVTLTIVLPSLLGFSLLVLATSYVVAYATGDASWLAAGEPMNASFIEAILGSYWLPLTAILSIAIILWIGFLILAALALVAAAATAVLWCLFTYVLKPVLYARVRIAYERKKKANASSSLKSVVSRRASNYWNKLCGPITWVNRDIPQWLKPGAVIKCDSVVGTLTSVTVSRNALYVEFTFDIVYVDEDGLPITTAAHWKQIHSSRIAETVKLVQEAPVVNSPETLED